MWQDGRDVGAGLCTRTRTRIGRTELSLTRPLSRYSSGSFATLAAIRRAPSRGLLKSSPPP
jgi:hypothetical protein